MKCDTLEAYFARLRQSRSAILTPASHIRLSAPVRVLVDASLTRSIQVGPICGSAQLRVLFNPSCSRSIQVGPIRGSAPLRVLFDPCLTRSIQVSPIGESASLRVLVDTARAESICVGPSRFTFDSRLVPSASSRRHRLHNISVLDSVVACNIPI